MQLKHRLIGALACGIVAMDCFEKNGGELQLPYWTWAVVGVCWIFNALGLLVSREDAA